MIDQPILIGKHSMAQFHDGGAMLMLYQTPENITEEHWDEPGVDVLSFHGKLASKSGHSGNGSAYRRL